MQSNEIPLSISNLARVLVHHPLSPSWYPLVPSSLPSTLRSPALMGRHPLVIGPRGAAREQQAFSRTAVSLRASCKVEVTNYFPFSPAPITCVPLTLRFQLGQTRIHSKSVFCFVLEEFPEGSATFDSCVLFTHTTHPASVLGHHVGSGKGNVKAPRLHQQMEFHCKQ